MRSGEATFEENKVRDLKEKRRRRKELIPGPGSHPCEQSNTAAGYAALR